MLVKRKSNLKRCRFFSSGGGKRNVSNISTVSNNSLQESILSYSLALTNKFDCLVHEMLCIQDLKPALNVQSDYHRAKVFM